MTKRAVALVELAADSWIVTGRRPVPIMMAAIYLAWQSLKPTKHRLRLTLDKFCQIAKVKSQKPALMRITEMKEVLCKLGNEIPWLRGGVTLDNVVHQVEDIIKYRYALLRRALRTHEEALLAECEDTAPSLITEEQRPNVEQRELNTETSQQGGDDREPTGPEPCGDSEEATATQNWGKRALFAPPCVIHAKKRRVQQPELTDITGDEEISDSEIDSYIRTPREARDFSLAQKILSISERDESQT